MDGDVKDMQEGEGDMQKSRMSKAVKTTMRESE
jgi:hypothetical protein